MSRVSRHESAMRDRLADLEQEIRDREDRLAVLKDRRGFLQSVLDSAAQQGTEPDDGG